MIAGSVLVEVNQLLVRRVAELEEQVSRAETGAREAAAAGELVRRLEEENREFADLCVRVQEENEALNGLYVASYRLHETLDPDAVVRAIGEILIDLVGAEEYALLLFDERHHVFERVAGEGACGPLAAAVVAADDPWLSALAASRDPVYRAPGADNGLPEATIPLRLHGETVGIIAIHRLLTHKHGGLSDADRQVLQLLAAHAATALVSSRLYSLTDRKLRTIEGFMRLLTGAPPRCRAETRGAGSPADPAPRGEKS